MVRIKNRYFVLELVGDREYDPLVPVTVKASELDSSIRSSILQLHGVVGSALATHSLEVTYCNEYTRVAIVRCLHAHFTLVASSLPMVSSVGSHNLSLRTLYRGATLMNCYKFLKRHQERRLEQIWSQVPEHQRHVLLDAFMSVQLLNTTQARHLLAVSKAGAGRLHK